MNQGIFKNENVVTNNGIFQNNASGTLDSSTGANREFRNYGSFTNAGTHISGGVFDNYIGSSTTQNGTHKGSGNFSALLFTNSSTATIAPGNPLGTVYFDSGLTNNGNINIEIGGATAGSTYDVVNVTGTATLFGVLNVSLFNNYQPPIGTQTYTILTATNRAGTFGTVNFPTLIGTTWSIAYNANSVVITSTTANTTTVTACDSYSWINNGQNYTASGTYQGNAVSGINQTLILTITPNSDNVTAVSNCGSYTWANNNQTYTQSGIYTGTTTNCVTEQLNLTITPNSDNVTAVSNCGSYTWTNNNQTYTTSGIYTGTTTNCVTEKLNLTITPNTDNVTAVSNCGSYTWANNNQTYTQSGIYTGTTTNCVTEQLNLTITPSSINTAAISACDSYVWNGTTYTASGIYTGTTTNCVIEKLNLTISNTNAPTATSNQTFCASETLANIAVTGTNIIWYNAAISGNALANTTLIQSGTTYYASQTINNCESPTRVAVTMTNGGCLANEDFDSTNFKYYPNPTNDKVSFSNSKTIDNIQITSILGQVILDRKFSTNKVDIDLSNYASGAYFVKIQSDAKEKLVKIIKQ